MFSLSAILNAYLSGGMSLQKAMELIEDHYGEKANDAYWDGYNEGLDNGYEQGSDDCLRNF